jgi:hypothetical protein
MDRAEFALRLYRWAGAEWKSELASDCARLMAVPSRTLRRVAERLLALPTSDRERAAAGLLKRFHSEAVTALGDRVLPEEQALVDRVLKMPLRVSPPIPPVDRKLLRRSVRERLTAMTGAKPDRSYETGVEWRHVQRVGAVELLTYVDTGGRPVRQVEYSQDVRSLDGLEIKRFISLASWLGITSATRFDLVAPGEEEMAAAQVVSLARYFADVLQQICPPEAA